jgi:hypothetical protein
MRCDLEANPMDNTTQGWNEGPSTCHFGDGSRGIDHRIDGELEGTFPASDPLPWIHQVNWPSADREGSRSPHAEKCDPLYVIIHGAQPGLSGQIILNRKDGPCQR